MTNQPFDLSTVFPPGFPPYHTTTDAHETATYLSQARYVVSLGGPPLADMNYGVVVVPFGEERMLFCKEAPPSVANVDDLAGLSNCVDGDWADDDDDDPEEIARE